jgi:dipeptidyl aminopeptidase/acylaminoacyl peptidase
MAMPESAPYGGWRSPITAASIAAGGVSLSTLDLVDGEMYWLEGKPLEGGRVVVVRQSLDGTRIELTPPPMSVRTRVHEYGGGAYVVHGTTVFFSNFVDQRLYRQEPGQEPAPITPEPPLPSGLRYADARVTADGALLICVRQRHEREGPDAITELVVLPTDGSGEARIIAFGHDFYSTPRISPDGRRLAWLVWDHPRMPWDGSELWVADLAADGGLSNDRRVAGGPEESIYQPEWSPDGVLHFVSDRTGWWNLYRVTDLATGDATPLAAMEAEFGGPQWVFGMESYTFLADGRIAAIYTRDGLDHLGLVAPDGTLQRLESPFTAFGRRLRAAGNTLLVLAGSPTEAAAIVRLNLASGNREVLRRSLAHGIDAGYISRPRSISFPTENGAATAYAIYYPPSNAEFNGPDGERPPLIVVSHGGPTAMAQVAFSLDIQYWTSRGFGVVDVNYGGSSGYGRPYRQRLNGNWGIVDTADCIAAARYLADQGEVDGSRLIIRGSSAGGYTTLCALVFHDDFAAGASYFGVADCETLATDTHKFESRYLDSLIGPYPQAKDVYYQRSPIHFVDRLSCPVILFQGLEDRVVPPSQAEGMVEALRARDLPVAYLAFEGEQHGFLKSATIQRTLEAELYFYSRIFQFALREQIEPVEIENLP